MLCKRNVTHFVEMPVQSVAYDMCSIYSIPVKCWSWRLGWKMSVNLYSYNYECMCLPVTSWLNLEISAAKITLKSCIFRFRLYFGVPLRNPPVNPPTVNLSPQLWICPHNSEVKYPLLISITFLSAECGLSAFLVTWIVTFDLSTRILS